VKFLFLSDARPTRLFHQALEFRLSLCQFRSFINGVQLATSVAFNSSCQYAQGTTWRDVTPISLFRRLTRVKHVSGNCCRQRETPQINSLVERDAVPKVFASDVFQNVVYYFALSHHGHFHAPVSSAGKLYTGLEFLKGTQWEYHRRDANAITTEFSAIRGIKRRLG
jgi:hypothetical protein